MTFGKRSVFGGSSARGEGMHSIALNLTALMDILSNLLFFLLASYTAQAVEVQQKAELSLPASSSQLRLTPQLTVTVTRSRIEVGGVPVATLEQNRLVDEVGKDGKIAPLFERLHNVKLSRAAAGRDDLADADGVLLLADKETDSAIITQVLKTAGHAGFVNVRFGVIAR